MALRWLIRWLSLLALSLAAGVCASNEAAPEVTAPEAAASAAALQGVPEAARAAARSTANWLARGVDSWFGDRPFDEGGKVSDGRMSIGVLKRQGERADVDVRFTAQFRLPNVERNAYLFVGRDDRRDAVRDTPDAIATQRALLAPRLEEPSLLAGLGLSLRDVVDFRLGVAHGLKPYAQARYDHAWPLAPDHLVAFRETVFWTNDDRFGSTTALSYSLTMSPRLALRWLGAVTITQETRNLEWSSSLGAYQSFEGQRLLSFEALLNGSGTKGTGVGQSDRGLLVKWEQPIHERWLFAEIVGGHFWPRRDSTSARGRAWAAGGSLKMRF